MAESGACICPNEDTRLAACPVHSVYAKFGGGKPDGEASTAADSYSAVPDLGAPNRRDNESGAWIRRTARWLRRKPIPPCDPLGHTWAWVGTTGPKRGEHCYCGRARWKPARPWPIEYLTERMRYGR